MVLPQQEWDSLLDLVPELRQQMLGHCLSASGSPQWRGGHGHGRAQRKNNSQEVYKLSSLQLLVLWFTPMCNPLRTHSLNNHFPFDRTTYGLPLFQAPLTDSLSLGRN